MSFGITANIAEPEDSRQISDALEFCYPRRQLMLVEGASGIGKSETVRAWCDHFPGLARYIEVPSSNNDRSFYVAIANALGLAQGAKTLQYSADKASSGKNTSLERDHA